MTKREQIRLVRDLPGNIRTEREDDTYRRYSTILGRHRMTSECTNRDWRGAISRIVETRRLTAAPGRSRLSLVHIDGMYESLHKNGECP
jgi:hypothetical protein